MNASHRVAASSRSASGYILVLFVVLLAFVSVLASMQVLVLTSVATTSRAYDAYEQGATELVRLEHAVAESVLAQRQIAVATPTRSLTDELGARLAELSPDGAPLALEQGPASLPQVISFPDPGALPDALSPISQELRPFLTPELGALCGPDAAEYPELRFVFTSQRVVLDTTRTYRSAVAARLIAVPLTRHAIAAYDLPSEIGAAAHEPVTGPVSELPAGLAPGRDDAFVSDLQSEPGVLPYHFRHRATLAAAYQYLFSQSFLDRTAEYAGITHVHQIGSQTPTATVAGMTTAGTTTQWDLGLACTGTYGTVTDTKDAVVVYAETAGRTLRLRDSGAGNSLPALLVLAVGPPDPAQGPLTLDLSTITRPVVVIGYNVRVSAPSGTAVNGALFLDPASSIAPGTVLTAGHLSYWAGTTGIPRNAVNIGPLPAAARLIAPRVVYVATRATRL